MARIENLTNQIKVVGSGNGLSDSIVYYNKIDNDGKTVLSVRAFDGNLIISKNGIDVESFLYSSVTEPVSNDLESLTLTVHKFIYDSIPKKSIDVGYASIVTNTEGLNNCKNYTHNTTTSTVECLDNDIESILFIFNKTRGRVLYMLGSEDYTGLAEGGIVTYDVKIPLSNRLDKLYILFRPIKEVTEQTYLRDIKNILEQNLTQSTLTSMILRDSYNSPLSEGDVKYN